MKYFLQKKGLSKLFWPSSIIFADINVYSNHNLDIEFNSKDFNSKDWYLIAKNNQTPMELLIKMQKIDN